jgi:hypothetical protein
MSDAGRRPPTLEEMAEPHQCWWRAMAEGLCDVLAVLDNDSQVSALRQLLRDETNRRKEAEHNATVWQDRAEQAGWPRHLLNGGGHRV